MACLSMETNYITDEQQKVDLGFQNYATVCMQMKNQWRGAPSEE